MPTVLVVEDRSGDREKIVQGLTRELGDGVTVIPFKPDGGPKEESYEHYIARWLDSNTAVERPSLIACDKELGLYENLGGFSATPVSAVASDRGIPFCLYSRQADQGYRDFLRRGTIPSDTSSKSSGS